MTGNLNVKFLERREALRKAVGKTLIVLTGADEMQKANDMVYPFVQDATFRYFTGVDEAGWRLVMTLDEGDILVAPHRSEVQLLFEGGLDHEEAQRASGVDRVIDASEFTALIDRLSHGSSRIAVIVPKQESEAEYYQSNPAAERLHDIAQQRFEELIDIRKPIAKLRAIKDADEIREMRLAIERSIEGFNDLYRKKDELRYEYEAEALLSYAFRAKGTHGHAYDPIVAYGKNACTLHYVKNDQQLEAGQLLLIDAGAVLNGYAADITRTYAVGDVSDRHKEIHAAVEAAHHEIIALIQPGVKIRDYIDSVDAIMKQSLMNVGLMQSLDDDIAYRTYFPHAISHGLGLDVHESLGGFETFQPGMVLTVEPGIYIPEEGIGVRIEDDILVTDNGNENLSAALPTSL